MLTSHLSGVSELTHPVMENHTTNINKPLLTKQSEIQVVHHSSYPNEPHLEQTYIAHQLTFFTSLLSVTPAPSEAVIVDSRTWHLPLEGFAHIITSNIANDEAVGVAISGCFL
jgi:hypothetical protein